MPIARPQTVNCAFAFFAIALQAIFILIFGLTSEYGDQGNPKNSIPTGVTEVEHFYPMFQDVHVMMFIGFGFLMTFLKKYGFSAVGFNFVLAALVIQWSILCFHFWHSSIKGSFETLQISITNLITGDFAAASVLISFGALLGKTSPVQLLAMAMILIVFQTLNEVVCVDKIKAIDVGGSMYVHMFGAFFGLGCSLGLSKCNDDQHSHRIEKLSDAGANKTTDTFAMIGTVFLWMYWPSFNGAMASGTAQHRVVVNTVFALCASCMAAFATSAFLRGGKFSMVDIQNATLAGGVAMGSAADLAVMPYAALIIGTIAGALSVVGYVYIQPALQFGMGLHDTCGVNNLHGMPGMFGAIVGAIAAAAATDSRYGNHQYEIWAARAPSNATIAASLGVATGDDRSAGEQGWYQIGAMCLTFGMALFSGALTGVFLAQPMIFDQPKTMFNDKVFWQVEEGSDDDEAPIQQEKVAEQEEMKPVAAAAESTEPVETETA